MSAQSSRMPLVDALKAIASQLIVLHHLAAYGPLSEAVQEVAPALISWLYDYGRIAVQAFLVVGGFLAARSLAPRGEPLFDNPLPLIWRRYQRLVLPYMAAVAVAIVAAAVARRWMIDDSIPDAPTWRQLLAHGLLLHDLLDYDALSAGVWYVAIDFQLFALMVLALWIGSLSGLRRAAPALVVLLGLAALFWFNRNADWDEWALYFFGSYGLGAVAWWASERRRLAAWLGAIATVAVAALMVDFRLRIAVALAVALTLGFARRSGWLEKWPEGRPLAFLSRISYSLFLVHFPVCLVANALFVKLEFDSAGAAAVGMLLAWSASIAAGTLFYRFVESAAPGWQIGSRLAGLFKALAGRILVSSPARSGS
ncbi:MAG TPA: acyltransferase family protein [Rhodocyclaceae bacterium]|nr:acyltransferase family protein [Rhodocyclaceae bacterium]